MWSIQDPKDPWAWRNTWTGEMRNSYDDLWIVIPIVVLVVLIAMILLIPILVHRYCPHCCPGRSWCRWFESLLFVMGEVSREKEEKRIESKRALRSMSRISTAPSFTSHLEDEVIHPRPPPDKQELPPMYRSVSRESSRPIARSRKWREYREIPEKKPEIPRRYRSESRPRRSKRRKPNSIPPLKF